MLKKGLAWHYSAYDQRQELAKVSKILSVSHFLHFHFLNLLYSKVCMDYVDSGKMRLERSESAYGLPQTLRNHGNGERTNEKEDNAYQ